MSELNREDSLAADLRALEARLLALESVNQLNNATLHGKIIVGPDLAGNPGRIQTSDFDGTDFAHPGSTGNYFGKDGLVANNLYLRPNSVANDRLVAPVLPGVVNQVTSNFAVPHGSWASVLSYNVTVPANCTQLLALATGMAFVVNPNTTGGSNSTGSDLIECRIGIGATFGMAAGVSISGSNGQTSCSGMVAALLTGLTPGATITLVTQATTGFQAFAANSANQANLCANLIWLR